MLPVIVAPDVELWATGWLRDALAGRSESYAQDVFVATRVPNPRRDRMVAIRRDGGARTSIVLEQPRLGVNVWATSDEEVSNLASLVAGLLVAGIDETVPSVRMMSGPSWVEDAQPRRYMTFETTTRGAAA